MNLVQRNYKFWVDGKVFLHVNKLKLSNMANISTASVRHEATVTDTMQNLLSYMYFIEQYYDARFVYVRVVHIVDHLMYSSFVAVNSRAN